MTRKRKASNGDGSIRQVTKNGRTTYVVEISLGYKADGTRRRTRRSARTHAEAKELRKRLLAQQQQGLLTELRPDTVQTFGLWWAREVKPETIRESTAADYEDRLRRYVFPYLGNVRLVDLTARDAQRWIGALRTAGKSSSTINGARRVLFGMCKHAVRMGIIAYNPVQATDAVKRTNEKTQVKNPWTEEEAGTVLENVVTDDRLDCYVNLMLHLGLRPGEAMGLRWQDIDEDQGVLWVTGTLKEERRILPDGRGVVRLRRNPPKTKSSHRPIDISNQVSAVLKRQWQRQEVQKQAAGEAWHPEPNHDYIITTASGKPVSPSNMRRTYKAFLERIGVRQIRMHDMRHTVARLGLEAGLAIDSVSQALGHTRTDTTRTYYSGYVKRHTRDFVNVMSALLPPQPVEIPDTPEALERLWQTPHHPGT